MILQIPNLYHFLEILFLKRNQYPNPKSWSLSCNLDYNLNPKKKQIPKSQSWSLFLNLDPKTNSIPKSWSLCWNLDYCLDSKTKPIHKSQIMNTLLLSWLLSWSYKETNIQIPNLDHFLVILITILIIKRNQYPNPKSWSLSCYLDREKKSIPKSQILITFLQSWSQNEINTQFSNLDHFLVILITILILKGNKYPNLKSWSLSCYLDDYLDPKKKPIHKSQFLITFLLSWLLSLS